jgi:phosphate-selective porin
MIQRHLAATLRLTSRGLVAVPLLLALGSTALAQQTTGTPGSPGAATTVDGRYLPAPPRSSRAISTSMRASPSRTGRHALCRLEARPTCC